MRELAQALRELARDLRELARAICAFGVWMWHILPYTHIYSHTHPYRTYAPPRIHTYIHTSFGLLCCAAFGCVLGAGGMLRLDRTGARASIRHNQSNPTSTSAPTGWSTKFYDACVYFINVGLQYVRLCLIMCNMCEKPMACTWATWGCIHTYIHTYIHTSNPLTYVNTHIARQTYTHIHTYIHTLHTYIHTYKHTYIHTYKHTYTHTYRRMRDLRDAQNQEKPSSNTQTHTYTHTHIHT